MRAFEVSETGVWKLSGITAIFYQTPDQTPARHLAIYRNQNSDLKVSDKVSGAVWMPSKCHCLTGGVSLGRASPDTQTKAAEWSLK